MTTGFVSFFLCFLPTFQNVFIHSKKCLECCEIFFKVLLFEGSCLLVGTSFFYDLCPEAGLVGSAAVHTDVSAGLQADSQALPHAPNLTSSAISYTSS